MSSSPHLLQRWYMRLALACIILGAWLWLVELSPKQVAEALRKGELSSYVGAVLAILLNLVVGAVRWQALAQSFGAPPPPLAPTVHSYLVAFFFNTFLPANLAGDVLRANAVTRHFNSRATAYALVLVERGLGLSALFVLAAGGAWAGSALSLEWAAGLGGLGMGGMALAACLPWLGRSAAPLLPRRLRGPLGSLPAVASWPRFVQAAGLALGTQGLFCAGAWLLLQSFAPSTPGWASFAVLPLALLAIYLPTLAGFGSREAAYVMLLGPQGVAPEDAAAASLAFGLCHLAAAAIGGIAHATKRMG